MARQKHAWLPTLAKKPTLSAPDSVKAEVAAKAGDLIDTTLKPKHVKPPPENERFNYVIDIASQNWNDQQNDEGVFK